MFLYSHKRYVEFGFRGRTIAFKIGVLTYSLELGHKKHRQFKQISMFSDIICCSHIMYVFIF